MPLTFSGKWKAMIFFLLESKTYLFCRAISMRNSKKKTAASASYGTSVDSYEWSGFDEMISAFTSSWRDSLRRNFDSVMMFSGRHSWLTESKKKKRLLQVIWCYDIIQTTTLKNSYHPNQLRTRRVV